MSNIIERELDMVNVGNQGRMHISQAKAMHHRLMKVTAQHQAEGNHPAARHFRSQVDEYGRAILDYMNGRNV